MLVTYCLSSCSIRYWHLGWLRDSYHCRISDRLQAIILTNAGILLIWPLGTNFSEIFIEIHTFSFKKMNLIMSSRKIAAILSRPECVKWLKPEHNSRHFAVIVFRTTFIKGKFYIFIQISANLIGSTSWSVSMQVFNGLKHTMLQDIAVSDAWSEV